MKLHEWQIEMARQRAIYHPRRVETTPDYREQKQIDHDLRECKDWNQVKELLAHG